MRQYTEGNIRILEPDEGLYLTDGQTYSTKVYLGKDADPAGWTEAEWDGVYPDTDDAEATASDYEAALEELGVVLDDEG